MPLSKTQLVSAFQCDEKCWKTKECLVSICRNLTAETLKSLLMTVLYKEVTQVAVWLFLTPRSGEIYVCSTATCAVRRWRWNNDTRRELQSWRRNGMLQNRNKNICSWHSTVHWTLLVDYSRSCHTLEYQLSHHRIYILRYVFNQPARPTQPSILPGFVPSW